MNVKAIIQENFPRIRNLKLHEREKKSYLFWALCKEMQFPI